MVIQLSDMQDVDLVYIANDIWWDDMILVILTARDMPLASIGPTWNFTY